MLNNCSEFFPQTLFLTILIANVWQHGSSASWSLHFSHNYLLTLCIDFLCVARCSIVVALYLQRGGGDSGLVEVWDNYFIPVRSQYLHFFPHLDWLLICKKATFMFSLVFAFLAGNCTNHVTDFWFGIRISHKNITGAVLELSGPKWNFPDRTFFSHDDTNVLLKGRLPLIEQLCNFVYIILCGQINLVIGISPVRFICNE